jgi:hypothetical protein
MREKKYRIRILHLQMPSSQQRNTAMEKRKKKYASSEKTALTLRFAPFRLLLIESP